MIRKKGYIILAEPTWGTTRLLGRGTTEDQMRGVEDLRSNGLTLFETLEKAKLAGAKYNEQFSDELIYGLFSIRIPTSRTDIQNLRDRNGLVAFTSEESPLWEKPQIEIYGPDLTELADQLAPDYSNVTQNDLTPFNKGQVVIPNTYSARGNRMPRRNQIIRVSPYDNALATRERLRDEQPQKKASIAQFGIRKVA